MMLETRRLDLNETRIGTVINGQCDRLFFTSAPHPVGPRLAATTVVTMSSHRQTNLSISKNAATFTVLGPVDHFGGASL
jgi:hypothetical protein